MRKFLLPGLLILLFLFITILKKTNYFSSSLSKNTLSLQSKRHMVTLEKNGFVPKEITIRKGDTIVFKTTRKESFWPASQLHPTHTIYPEFDPKRPTNPRDSWNFTFNKVGIWNYHDHLAPLFKGTVKVINLGENSKNPLLPQTACEKKDANQKIQCWEKELEQTLQSQGLEQAFDLFNTLYLSEPLFAQNCHGYTHQLGEKAYLLFSQHKNFKLSNKAAYCGYGFYHGFIDWLLQKNGKIQEARDFCTYLQKSETETSNGAWQACYHGFGHGVVDGSDPKTWGNDSALIAPGLSICEKVGETDTQKDLCASGVFNSLANKYGNSEYKLRLDKENPYRICEEQSKDYFKKPCYEEMNTIILPLGNDNLFQASRFIEKIKERKYAIFAIRSTAGYASFFDSYRNSLDKSVRECKMMAEYLRIPCITGFVGGLIEKGLPDKEYLLVLDYCDSQLFDGKQRETCYSSLLDYGSRRYPKETYRNLCGKVEKKYKKICLQE